ncbi:MAG: M3 family metallopeptidase, partial [Clostridia bacterium]|nr:M3 family metallopeptidase [Clostridia bacterium]
LEWARIPHFYRSFYVYKYATGFCAATALTNQILNEGQAAVGRYIKFLSSGGSDYPINLLKNAGVDMTSTDPVNEALKTFSQMVNELEKILL